ncbi:hypothetical protein A2Z00_04020 [Candidatus Gottesmanbacteria bacterium RBG_13_45_10]|uniref:Glycosyltransferase RgtA/B/C/D-like domain-containing protein n=1 Tax=Candidatus Gottesmanbacteria bacterium RBG_13_45_10 TaxID=1798370 RepID=A0A1F5ZIL6_9BACT|nr:MAG: hypothetical protein A2Z00_04020 [Candidatus Gottesmanbacteria bacterium RBG_13_45_10]
MPKKSFLSSELLPLSLILISGVFIRLLYFHFYPTMFIAIDSYGYYGMGNGMVANPSLATLINPFRTPVYPVFISLLAKMSGNFNAAIGTPAFTQVSYLIMGVQSVISISALLLFYMLLRQTKIKKLYAFLFVLFESVNIAIFAWDKALITESFSLSWTLVMSYIAIHALKRPTTSRHVVLFVFGVIGILLRPSFAIVPLVVLVIIFLFHQKANIRLQTAGTTCAYVLTVIAIAGINFVYHGYFGIQNISDINILGRILQFNLPVEAAKTIQPLYGYVIDYRSKNLEPMPYTFINYYNIDTYSSSAKLNTLKNFTQTVMRTNMVSYLALAFLDIPKAVLSTDDLYRADTIPFPYTLLFTAVRWIRMASQYLSLAGLGIFPVAVIQFLRKPSFTQTAMFLVGSIGVAQVLVIVMLGPGYDYGRLLSSASPLLFLFSAYWFSQIIVWLSRSLRNVIFPL